MKTVEIFFTEHNLEIHDSMIRGLGNQGIYYMEQLNYIDSNKYNLKRIRGIGKSYAELLQKGMLLWKTIDNGKSEPKKMDYTSSCAICGGYIEWMTDAPTNVDKPAHICNPYYYKKFRRQQIKFWKSKEGKQLTRKLKKQFNIR